MPICMSIKDDGTQCTCPAKEVLPDIPIEIPAHLQLCRMHQRTYLHRYTANGNHHHRPEQCRGRSGLAPTWCQHDAVGQTGLCAEHNERNQRVLALRARNQARRIANVNAFLFFRDRVPRPNWRQVLREILAPDLPEVLANPDVRRYEVLRRYYMTYHSLTEPVWFEGGERLVEAHQRWMEGGELGPAPRPADFAPPALPALALLSQDSQNVHRAVVSEQTNRSVELLLSTPNVSMNCRAPELLAAHWLSLALAPWKDVVRVTDDIINWRNKATCRTENDHLYRRVLHGLFMRVYTMTDKERRSELWKRFYEECNESVGMCCEGHISRLCNVLVGFEDDFKPPVPFGEIVQTTMAKISEMDAPLEEKVKLAMAFFDEHKVPLEARTAWLDAF